MVPRVLIEDMKETENRLMYRQVKKKMDIQMLASNGAESCAFIDDSLLDHYNLIIGFVSNEKKVCNGRYNNQHFSLPLNQDSELTRVWLDCSDTKDIRYHANICGNYHGLSKEQDERSDELMIVLLDCPDFVQFSLYDGRLAFKVSHIFTTADQVKEKIKTVAYSMLNQNFLGLSEYLLQLEGDIFGEK